MDAPNGPALQVVSGPESLADVQEAYAYLEDCRERAERAKCVLVETIRDARSAGESVRAIAAAMKVTRQYVQKVLREAEAGEAEAELAGRILERQAAADMKASLHGLGFTAADRQCGVCHRFKSAPSAVCDYCGDDPVTWNAERRDYDAAVVGGIR
jgi:hypothetical protein